MSDRERGDGYRIAEDFNLISRVVDDGLYKAIRYQELGYEHLREDAIGELEKIQSMVGETLEEHSDG